MLFHMAQIPGRYGEGSGASRGTLLLPWTLPLDSTAVQPRRLSVVLLSMSLCHRAPVSPALLSAPLSAVY